MNRRVAWKEVGVFLVLTFGLTLLLNLLLYLTTSYDSPSPSLGLILQAQMLLPAFSAILLQMFFFKSSPIHVSAYRERPRWFFYFFLAYTVFYLVASLLAVSTGNDVAVAPIMVVAQVLTLGGLILVVVLRLVCGGEAFQRAGLAWGKPKYWILFGLLVIAVYGLMTGLNWLLGLGEAVDIKAYISQAAPEQAAAIELVPSAMLLLSTGFQAVLLSPFMALIIAFGEEYGWRGYLQNQLIRLGKIRGVLLLGVIWGLWHAPVIAMGHNYPGYPVAGIFLMVLYTIALSFIFGLAVLKSGGIWIAAFLHGLNNQVYSFLSAMVYKPDDPVLSFGVGLYGVVILLIVAGLLLLDPVWRRDEPSGQAQVEPHPGPRPEPA
jgi:membrane protease YdiL (CAAX protease family)